MIINAKNVFLYKCPECDDFVELSVSLFDIPKNNKIEVPCMCQKSSAEITNTSSGYQVKLLCFLCGDYHTYNVSFNDFWNSSFYGFSCPNAMYDIAAIGDYEQVDMWKENYDEMLESICVTSDNGYFENDDIMFSVMGKMKELDDNDKIYCQCGNHEIDFTLYSDKLRFECCSCNSYLDVYTRNKEDFDKVEKLEEVILQTSNIRSPKLSLVKK